MIAKYDKAGDREVRKKLEKNSKKLEKNFGELDCISRADARSLICKIDIKHHLSGMSRKAFKELYNGIDELPSVTPQEPRKSRDMEEIEEVINCDADAEIKCKIISNILTAKPHYFEEPQGSEDRE